MKVLLAVAGAMLWTALAFGAGWFLRSPLVAPPVVASIPTPAPEVANPAAPVANAAPAATRAPEATRRPAPANPAAAPISTPNAAYVNRPANATPLLDEAWSRVRESYVGELPGNQQRDHAAIRGALELLGDKYTSFLEPRNRQIERETYAGRFGGIGVTIFVENDGRAVLTTIRGLPAERAGVRTGDQIVAVADWPVPAEKPEFNDIAARVRGEPGSRVTITVLRDGKRLNFDIVREIVEVPSVEWRVITDTARTAQPVGYIRVSSFTERTGIEAKRAITELQALGARAWVLDLRDNGGGLISTASDLASQFMKDGNVLIEVKKTGENNWPVTRGGILAGSTDPLAVLVNSRTASAGEIVAGALQDVRRGMLIGEKTVGKGSAQLLYDLSDGSSVHVTNSRWLTPNRRTIQDVGVQPDIVLAREQNEAQRNIDTQLDRALKVVNGQGAAQK